MHQVDDGLSMPSQISISIRELLGITGILETQWSLWERQRVAGVETDSHDNLGAGFGFGPVGAGLAISGRTGRLVPALIIIPPKTECRTW